MSDNYIILIDENGQPYIAHHGIKGQKWGIRRYQNDDGTLTDLGKKRYGNQLGKDIQKVTKDPKVNPAAGIQKVLSKNKAIESFNKNNETYNKLQETNSKIKNIASVENDRINKELTAKYGRPDPFNNSENFGKYMEEGIKMMQKFANDNAEMRTLLSDKQKFSQEYERQSREYLGDLLGKYKDVPVNTGMAIKYDPKTNKFSKQTIQDITGIEMLRKAGGVL